MKIGIITPSVPGHLNPSSCLGQALQEAGGHDVTMIVASHRSDDIIEKRGLKVAALIDAIPKDDVNQQESFKINMMKVYSLTSKLADLRGIPAFRLTVEIAALAMNLHLKCLPTLLRIHNFDALLIDEIYDGPMSVAEVCNIPYGVICSALPFMQDPVAPPVLTTWQPPPPSSQPISPTDSNNNNSSNNNNNNVKTILSMIYRWRNVIGNYYIGDIGQAFHETNNKYRMEHGLRPKRNNRIGSGSPLGEELFYLCQCPSFLDFPREHLPPHFHHTGPWHNLKRDQLSEEQISFLDMIDKKKKKNPNLPLIYASLGTLQNGIKQIFVNLAKACCQLESEVQLVISLGRQGATLDHPIFQQSQQNYNNDNIIVVDYCPQLELLKRASILVTHAGQNTALEGLAINGLPMVAIPITNDQPGVAARWARAGVAKIVTPEYASVSNLQSALHDILTISSYRQAAKDMQRRLQTQSPSLASIAELIGIAFQPQSHHHHNGESNNSNTKIFPRNHPESIRILGPPSNDTSSFETKKQQQQQHENSTHQSSFYNTTPWIFRNLTTSFFASFVAAAAAAGVATTFVILNSSSGRQQRIRG